MNTKKNKQAEKPAKNTNNKKVWAKRAYVARQVVGQSVLAAGTIGFIAQNLDVLTRNFAVGIGGLFVVFVLYFANKK